MKTFIKYKKIFLIKNKTKTITDEYIIKLCNDNPILHNYDIKNNKGYGTKNHILSLTDFGPTQWHRKSFKPCH